MAPKEPKIETLRTMRDRHRKEEEALLRAALKASDWKYLPTCKVLDCHMSTIQSALTKFPELKKERDRRRAESE